ncbi:glycosylphosphatidylinositol-alpha 1,4 mannosyltransferase I [Rhodotorula paludigena]|uniref:glycosylphosphatidylinositol-alpha 1,4 mannosyltransferase I n=1 Tax=Rhodotorula paludigena TaxID=86838 RepID=UPI00316EAF3A
MQLARAVGLGAALRAILLVWGHWQDHHGAVRYTDVDYFVFSDAAKCLVDPHSLSCSTAEGAYAPSWLGDPYARSTYRYTPLVAALVAPNHRLHPDFGKVCFAVCDLLVGALLYRLLRRRGTTATYAGRAVAAIWLLNPIIANISTRGSSEAIIGAVVVSVLSLAKQQRWDTAAALFGLAVHVKIFPFLYGSSLLAALAGGGRRDWRQSLARIVRFGLISFTCFMTLNIGLYLLFGEPFLRETFLYHLSRLDHRHNFSSYFYPFYLSSSPAASPASASLSPTQQFARSPLSAFVPQLVLSLGLGFLFGAQDLPFAWLVQTFAFVTLNKVCTSQYFLWYLWLLPAALPSLSFTLPRALFTASLWVLSQALWLSQAFRLEMLGEPVYRHVWGAGIVFLFAQSWVLVELLRAYRPVQRSAGELDKLRGKVE